MKTYQEWYAEKLAGPESVKYVDIKPYHRAVQYIAQVCPTNDMLFPDVMAKLITKKAIFWDFHGVLFPFRGNDRYTLINIESYLGKFFYEEDPLAFKRDQYDMCRFPPASMIRLTEVLDPNMQYVLSTVTTNKETEAEREVLEKFYPHIPIEHHITVGRDEFKVKVMEEMFHHGLLCKPHMTPMYDICLVDDTLSIIQQVESVGFSAYHISMLIP